MKIIRIKKPNGKYRVIYAPSPQEKEDCRRHLRHLSGYNTDVFGVQHGFRDCRSPVTNAMAHRQWRYTLSFDLKSFFDTVCPDHLPPELTRPFGLVQACFVDGAARQGLPTSPVIANIAAQPMDQDIVALNEQTRFGMMFAYTRYADDLTFSFNYPGIGRMLKEEIPKIAKKHRFEINTSKTHLQCARQGRRHITGVAVDEHGVHMPRATKRKLRAIHHQIKEGLRGRGLRFQIARQKERKRKGEDVSLCALLHGQYRGLTEWAKLRLPGGYRQEEFQRQQAAATAAAAATVVNSTVTTGSTAPTPELGQRRFVID